MLPRIKFEPRAPHHAYTGLLVIFLGASIRIMSWCCEPYQLYDGIYGPMVTTARAIYGIGALIVVDDVIEHTITASTPLRVFAEKVLFPFLRSLRK